MGSILEFIWCLHFGGKTHRASEREKSTLMERRRNVSGWMSWTTTDGGYGLWVLGVNCANIFEYFTLGRFE